MARHLAGKGFSSDFFLCYNLCRLRFGHAVAEQIAKRCKAAFQLTTGMVHFFAICSSARYSSLNAASWLGNEPRVLMTSVATAQRNFCRVRRSRTSNLQTTLGGGFGRFVKDTNTTRIAITADLG